MRSSAFLTLSLLGSVVFAECKLTETRRKYQGAERTIVTLENERILVEVVPELEGRIARYADKARPASAFEWLDDCPYHYGARWEGKPFTHRVDAKGPERAAVTVSGGGKIAVSLLRSVTGVPITSPLDLQVERTMAIQPGSTRLQIDVRAKNVGDGVAPLFRYMVHAVFGQVPDMKEGKAFWFLPTASGVEFFDQRRGGREMGESAGSGGAPPDHPFSRFTPGVKADKPRYEPGGWGALLTSAGPIYIAYDPKQYGFMQYWFGGDAEWHFTFEPHTKPVDLKPGDTVAFSFALACDARDVAFSTPTVAYQRPDVPTELTPGGSFPINARATTVRERAEEAKVAIEVKDPQGKVILSRDVSGEAKPFAFTDLAAECKIPDDAALGVYTWTAKAEGRGLASGKIDVVSPAQLEKLRMERATAALRAKYEETIKRQNEELERLRKLTRLWQDAVNVALELDDRSAWPDAPHPGASVAQSRGSVPVMGLWKEKELPRIKAIATAALPSWPDDPEKLLAALKEERAAVRDVCHGWVRPTVSSTTQGPTRLGGPNRGTELFALLVDPAKKRVEVARLGEGRILRRLGRFAEKPEEGNDTLGADARAIAVDGEGNVWVATNAWGQTTAFQRGADGAPFETSVVGAKGALKRFSPEGKLLGSVSLLDAPTDLAVGSADGVPVVLASYRNVSEYHGAQVREGVMVVRVSDAARLAEIKAPAGSVCLDEAGRVWTADVAGHVACFDVRGRKLFDVAATPAPAVPDAKLPPSSPLPAIVRSDGKGTVWALFPLTRKLVALDAKGAAQGDPKAIPEAAGDLWRLGATQAGPVAIGSKALWQP